MAKFIKNLEMIATERSGAPHTIMINSACAECRAAKLQLAHPIRPG